MRALFVILVLGAALAAAPGAAPAGEPRLALSAMPTFVTLAARSSGLIQVTNPSAREVTVDVSTANFTIGVDGKVQIEPKVAPNRTARSWISVSPTRLRLAPGGHTEVTVASHAPRRAEPGDHQALVLLTANSPTAGAVGVRTRIGVGVFIRMPGTITRRLAITGLTANRHELRLRLANRGNVNERLPAGRITIALRRGGKTLTTLTLRSLDLLPSAHAELHVQYRGRLHGRFAALVRVLPAAQQATIAKQFSISL